MLGQLTYLARFDNGGARGSKRVGASDRERIFSRGNLTGQVSLRCSWCLAEPGFYEEISSRIETSVLVHWL